MKKEIKQNEMLGIDQKEFGKRLHDVRVANNVTQDAIAKACGLGRNYISSIERGLYKANVYTVITYAKLCDTSIDDIVGITTTKHIIPELKKLLIDMDNEKQETILQMVKLVK